jgi:RimJ/RimL family protein N-acetyltransferase
MIHGARVTLRPFRLDDLPYLRRWFDDGEVMRCWGERQPLLPAESFAADLAPGGRFTHIEQTGYFWVADETSRALGYLQYEGGALRDRRAQIGILIGERDAWDQGYGTEAVVVLLNWLFSHRGFHRVWLTVQANNPRAARVYEKIGFVREGTLREHNFYDGRWQDEHVYGILAAEFDARFRPELTEWVVSGALP